ncbi:PREDICTED: 28S ribosomal protein S11, mitochondrial isoform X2 [Galeopterus variegatus]|uniref:28S ribosomal protein S11, mitochondrial isoform X2 n=1 Tax=Galeopterus variegatus TaxID=482537 RepID=A0ABM0Q9E4_GALVR|nr:PREDICTED: 28S ribosomal protein S11, mitochondrial isoform X2 [Galeopterus variegatus]
MREPGSRVKRRIPGARGAGAAPGRDAADGSRLGSIQVMQVVRNAGSWLLRSWAWPRMTGVVARAPAQTIHTGSRELQDVAAKQEVEEKAAAPSRSSFSIYPPVPGQESPLRWAGKKFEEIPIAHIKASYNNTQIQVVSATNQPLARTSCGTEGFRNAKKGTGIAAQTAAIAAAAMPTVGIQTLDLGVTKLCSNQLSQPASPSCDFNQKMFCGIQSPIFLLP